MTVENELAKLDNKEVKDYINREIAKSAVGGALTAAGVLASVGAGLGFVAGGCIGSLVGATSLYVGITPDEFAEFVSIDVGGSMGGIGGAFVGTIAGGVAFEMAGIGYTIKKAYNAYVANQRISEK